MAEALLNNIKEVVTDWTVERSPQLFHRLPAAEEVAGLIAYLLGDESKFLTKTTYEIGGGYGS
jgi:NAD(P)-dependent dehydrogenase (short-subunit alcohol dehydrogenase family)